MLVDFWATWCPPCVAISPDILGLYKKYHDKGFEIVGVSADSDKQALLNFVKKEGAPCRFGIALERLPGFSAPLDYLESLRSIDRSCGQFTVAPLGMSPRS